MLLKRRFILLALLMAWFGRDGVRAQQKQPLTSLQEDCGVTFSFTAASSGAQASGTVQAGSTGTTAVIDNRAAGCVDWIVTYSTTSNVSALSLDFQTAINVAGNPGTWSDYGGTLTSGINPNTAATTPLAITQATGTQYNFLRMNLTALTGAGTVSGTLKGWKRRPPAGGGGSGGSGCPGTVGTPCIVAGPDATGVAPTKNPVQVAGIDDNGNVLPLSMDPDEGVQWVEPLNGATPFNVSIQSINPKTFTPVPTFNCNSTAPITISGAGTITLVAAQSPGTFVHICSIALSLSGPATIQFIEGTQTTTPCDTTAADMSGPFSTVQSYTQTWGFAASPQPSIVGNGVCLTVTGTVTGGGWITYVNQAAT